MGDIVLAGATSGTTTLTPAAVSGTTTLTLPATTDTLVGKTTTDTLTNKTLTSPTITGASITVASTAAPAFSAYQNSAQTLSSGVVTKIQLQAEEWDTASCFDNSTNYRFTPNVAGYYQINGGIQVNATVTVINVFLYKNGSLYKFFVTSNTATLSGGYGSSLVYLNGSTDYVELYAAVVVGQALNVNGTAGSWFNGAMVRSA